jgi:glutathione S-transferase
MIKLFQFPRPDPSWGIPNFSPFCVKVETYLKMASLEYEAVDTFDTKKGSKGKLPVIDDQGKIVPDSSFILKYLKTKYGDKLDGGLSPKERAIGHMVQRMLEENFYFVAVYFRWVDDAGWEKTKTGFFEKMPAALKLIAPPVVRSKMRTKLDHQGMGRHSAEEIADIGKADLEALAGVLEDKTFLFGNEPTSFDAIAFAFTGGQIYVPIASPIKTFLESHPKLRPYTDRIRNRYFA